MKTGKLMDNIRVTKNGLGSGVDRIFKSSGSAFNHIINRLNPFGKSVEFNILFLGPLPGIHFTCIHDDIKALVPWKRDRFPIFRAFALKISMFFISHHYLDLLSLHGHMVHTNYYWDLLSQHGHMVYTNYYYHSLFLKCLFWHILWKIHLTKIEIFYHNH